ncbi:MAG: histidinol dehydrogenase [Solirubrobacteraceae bacterium]|nr:histidinol dehydrogenase [Solirubrobacteraceae bacterium]
MSADLPIQRFTGDDPAAVARSLRIAGGTPDGVRDAVAGLIAAVETGGDAALAELVSKHDLAGQPVEAIRIPTDRLDAALLPADVRAGLETAITNVATVADAGVSERTRVVLPQGHTVDLREVPVRSAAIYAPGGQAAYPSTIVMGVVTARAAGVERICVLTPPHVSDVVLGTAALCGIDEVYAMGGAHGVAALALGTETIERVDVIAGPGSIWAQEAKRQLADRVGIDGYYGPSDLAIAAGADAPPELVALDLMAQGEHGGLSTVLLASASAEMLDAVEAKIAELATDDWPRPAVVALVQCDDDRAALAVCEAYAPEHLQLIGEGVEKLAREVRSAGCLLVGPGSATAFGDYVAGSNHCLPTAGSARFASGLSTRVFRRKMSEVRIGPESATTLAWLGAPVARSEGFPWHARSMEARMRQDEG